MSLVIDNQPRAYDWGAPGGIARLRGVPSRAYHSVPDASGEYPLTDPNQPEAELWLGTHPTWQSVVAEGPERGELLGDALHERGLNSEVGFLLKVLSIDKPLSLQVHPDAAQAREGFAHEEALGLDLTDSSRNYRDPYAKPEMLFVLSETFELCAGVRDIDEILIDIRRAARNIDPARVDAAAHEHLWRAFAETLEGQLTVSEALAWLLANDASNARDVTRAITSRTREGLPVFGIERDSLCAHLDQFFPDDPGIALSLLLRHELLRKGQAIYLEPRIPHFYIKGDCVELMGPSDNVLRAGLTQKHIDAAAVQAVINPVPSAPRHLYEYHKDHTTVFHAAGAGLRLAFASTPAAQTLPLPFHEGDIVYVLSGKVTIHDHTGAEQTISTGQAALLTEASALTLTAADTPAAAVLAGATAVER